VGGGWRWGGMVSELQLERERGKKKEIECRLKYGV
jgi:hypothetical protein